MEQNIETDIVIFGATGDLAKKKLWLAVETLVDGKHIQRPNIIGIANRSRSLDEFSELVHQSSKKTDWYKSINYLSGDLSQSNVFNSLNNIVANSKAKTLLIILAVAPNYFIDIAKGLEKHGLLEQCRSNETDLRIMIEKPFGTNLETAKELDDIFCTRFKSDEIYRTDHYLGKSILQNIYSLRFSNPWFETGLNGKTVTRIEVNFLESNNASDRGMFYDQTGAWRDVGQNHLMQFLAAGIMQMPKDPHDVNNKRVEVIDSLKPISVETWKKGQYKGYRDINDVAKDSVTETYFEVTLESSLECWKNVPIILQGGKSAGKDEVSLTFYLKAKHFEQDLPETRLKFCSTPIEEALIELWGQDDAHGQNLEIHPFRFSYQTPKTDAYERVILSAIQGNQRWFASSQEIIAAWKLSDEISEKLLETDLQHYPVGGLGSIK